MAVKPWELAGVRDVASVWKTILGVARGEIIPHPAHHSPRTCWVAVGMYLQQNPDTNGMVWFYGPPGSQVSDPVSHVILTTARLQVLRDTMKTAGGMQLGDGTHYKLPNSDETYEVMAWKRWPLKG